MFSKKIKEIRKNNQLTQKDFDKKIDSTQDMVSRYEKGDIDLSTAMIIKICKTFNVSADYLLGLSD